MRTLDRNKQPFYYAVYESRTGIEDEYGNLTGEYTLSYSDPIEAWANISAAKGTDETEQFGQNLDYDKTLAFAKVPDGFSETSVLWIDTLPLFDEDGLTTTPYDYIVKRIGKSINSVVVAVKKVQVNG